MGDDYEAIGPPPGDSVEPPKLFAPPSLPPPITPPVERFSEQVHEKSVNSNADQKRSSDSKKTMKDDGTTEEQDVEEEKQKKKKRHKTIIIKRTYKRGDGGLSVCRCCGVMIVIILLYATPYEYALLGIASVSFVTMRSDGLCVMKSPTAAVSPLYARKK
uniref:Uncharacterized protein n=1 Tax=Ascaris lumbricoides TaxID=6252 RepID=A0A0M3HRQ8_ASCLU